MKVPEPQKLKSGNWRIRLRLGGEELSITRGSVAACRSEARLIKAEYLAGKREAVRKPAGDTTLSELLENYVKRHQGVLSPSTVRGYQAYIKTRFKAYQSRHISEIDFQQMVADELRQASPKTIKNAWGLVHAALADAGFPEPKVRLPQVPVNEIAFLQPEEIKLFCAAVKGKPYETAALIMLHGLRMSELKALQWKNIDTKKETITVHGAVVRGPEGKTRKETNKNRTSTRTVPVMIPRLSELLEAGRAGADPDAVVVTTNPSNLLDDVKRACRAAGVTEVTCHGLRHSFASLCYYLRISERQCMQWGGWADFQTMHRIYIRLAASAEAEAVEAVKQFFT